MNKSAALQAGAAHPQVVSLWIDLQARLMLLIDEVGAHELQEQLRTLGVRQPRTVAKNLAKELKCAKAKAESMNAFVTDMDLHQRTYALPRHLNYQFNLRELQRAYEALLMHCANSVEVALWIQSRISIHEFQLKQLV